MIDVARKTPTPKESNLSSFIDYSNAINNLVTTADTLEVPANRDNPQLLQELVDKLPDSFKIQWGLYKVRLGSASANLLDFSDWVSEIAEAASFVSVQTFSFRDKRKEGSFATEEVTYKSSSYAICKGNHNVNNCDSFKNLEGKERWAIVKNHNFCFRCLRANHSIKDCRRKGFCRADE